MSACESAELRHLRKVCEVQRDYIDGKINKEIYQRQIDELGKFVLSRTNIPEDIFYENFENDWYLSAKEAIEYKVADRIIKSLDEII